MMILGIDPGYDRLGWACVRKTNSIFEYVDAGCITTTKKESDAIRLGELRTQLDALLRVYPFDCAIVETLFFTKNQKTVMQVAQARGVILSCLAHAGINVIELSPMQIKSQAAGDGHADKKAVEKMVRLQIKNIPVGLLDDTIDALAATLAG